MVFSQEVGVVAPRASNNKLRQIICIVNSEQQEEVYQGQPHLVSAPFLATNQQMAGEAFLKRTQVAGWTKNLL